MGGMGMGGGQDMLRHGGGMGGDGRGLGGSAAGPNSGRQAMPGGMAGGNMGQGFGDSGFLGGLLGGGPLGQATPSIAQDGGMAPSPALSGTGQSPQAPMTTQTSNPQPPSGMVDAGYGVGPLNAQGMQAAAAPKPAVSAPLPPTAQPPQIMPPGQMNPGQQNKLRVHNPTGIGTQVASEKAGVMRPIPGNYPKKAQGMAVPMPAPTPGAKA